MPTATTKPVRLSVDQAAGEFGLDPATLRKLIRQSDIQPGRDRKYGINQIHKLVHGDLNSERLGKTRAERELLEIELAKERKEVISREHVVSLLENVFVAVKMKIYSSGMSDLEKEQILNDLVSLKDNPDV